MRYTEINEGSMARQYNGTRRQPIEVEQAFEYIRTHCSSALKDIPIFRGAKRRKASEGPMIVDTHSTGDRLSANTKSYVGILMDNLPAWAAYPKRSKSLICTTSPDYARAYGIVYRVFPVNGTKIGVCSDTDVWSSFSEFQVPRINGSLTMLAEEFLHTKLSEEPTKFFEQIQLISEHLDQANGFENIINASLYAPLPRFVKEYNTTDLMEIFKHVMDPKANGFHLTQVGALPQSSEEYGKEIWMEGKFVLIPKSLWGDLNAYLRA